MFVLECAHLTKIYGRGRQQKVAVNQISFQVEAGQVYGFLGPNGAGKTTTIRMLLGLIRPTQGQTLIFGQNSRSQPSVLRRTGAMVEGATFYPYLTGWDNLKVVGHSRGKFEPVLARQLTEQLDLTDALQRRVGQYSTGMRQRLGIAAALLNHPELVMLDEPTSGMDPAGIRDMRLFIRSLAEQGKTVFLTSHLLGEVQQVCDHISIINQGQIIRTGTINELLDAKPQLFATVSDNLKASSILQPHWPLQCRDNGIYIEAQNEEAPMILQRLIEHNVSVFSITPYQMTLESYFLELTGESQP
jgi:ABC-2 type transport system ATP-binding protein